MLSIGNWECLSFADILPSMRRIFLVSGSYLQIRCVVSDVNYSAALLQRDLFSCIVWDRRGKNVHNTEVKTLSVLNG